jgi:hypothetical protein
VRPRWLHGAGLGAAVLASTLAGGVARADPVSDAKDLFARGRDLRASGDCASAVVAFRKAYALYPAGLGSLRNTAECEEQIGHFASSRRAWLDLKRALVTTRDRKYDGWDHDADDAAARLAPKVATLTVDVNVAGPNGDTVPADSVEVTVNGEKLPTTLLGTALDRDPGEYVVRVTGANVSNELSRDVTLTAGDGKRVALHVVLKQVEAPPKTGGRLPGGEQPFVAHGADDPGAGRRTAGWITVAFGGAALVGAGISLIVRQTALSDLQTQCPNYASGGPCDISLKPTVDRGGTASLLFDVLGVAGLVAVAGGIVLVTTSAAHGERAALVIGPASATAVWRF